MSDVTRRRFLTVSGLALAAWTGSAIPAARASGDARVIAEERAGPRLVDLTIRSSALAGTAKVRLLTPDGWRPGIGRRWPVLYLLHGMGDDHTSWTRDSDVSELPQLRDVLVVMPDGGAGGYYTNWWNLGAGGPPAWETFHLDEVRRLLERGYGAGTDRVVAGLSMGGFGAVSYAARRPGMFRAAAAYSGPVHLSHPRYVKLFEDAYAEVGDAVLVLWGHPVHQREIWRAHDPYALAGRLRRIPVHLSCGDGHPGPLDPPGEPYDDQENMLHDMNRSLAARLTAAGTPLTTYFYRGTHAPRYWERELHRSLPMLLRSLHR
ncbi:alpha/beta hydrolase family protein [Streptosporangium sp. 'caverna']|uniref:alpha/beta hydrolase n=1 Tax=Streptosporangium sp. 'caverna' TaxID=2202249 RepID=UPI000D7E264F|nr:alpha/beta hydrolase family protein [Streptosporangium sp. 'caverna']AWS43462.1 hypothetical protein DKM19_20850 [Streptosporangium sp. 'caverna']